MTARCDERRYRGTSRSRVAVLAPASVTVAGLVLLAVVVALLVTLLAAATAPAAGAAAWTAGAGTKIFPDTPAESRSTLELFAAGDEYEGGQIAVRGGAARSVSLSWTGDSSPLLVQNSTLHRIGYVTIRRPSTGTNARRGDYPDPLLPAHFGQAVSVPASSTSFYVLVHVPRGTDGGLYTGTIAVNEGGSVSTIAVRLNVYAFDLPRQRVPALLSINQVNVKQSLRGAIRWTHENQVRVMGAYYDFYKEYGFSPGVFTPVAWVDKSNGRLTDRDVYASRVSRWLNDDADHGGFAVTRYPWSNDWPWKLGTPTAQKAKTIGYLTNLLRLYKERGWAGKAYAFPVDEPSPGRAERKAEAYARMLHAASAKAGFHAKYLLTSEPRPVRFKGRPANRFLFDDVDIWATRVYRYWDWLTPLRQRQAAGKEAWMYTYSFNPQARKAPTFLIDEPLADEHAMFWMMWRWNADGMLYWRANKWSKALGGGYRDPFLDPLSFKSKNGSLVFNGEASLLYPGYEPRLGLKDPYARPLSSLRFEALRDGIEEHSYLQLATELGTYGSLDGRLRGLANELADTMTYYPTGAYPWNWTNIPVFNNDADAYAAARRRLAEAIERARVGQAPNAAAGRVLDAGGSPIQGATVSDGVLSTTTAADGSFRLEGVLASYQLTVSHPRYSSSSQTGQAGATVHELRLAAGEARLITAFSSRSGVSLRRATATPSSARVTTGTRALRVTLRGRNAEFVYNLPARWRNLRWAQRIELDVYNPSGMNWKNPWKLKVVAFDSRGKRTWQRYILKPKDWTHISLPLTGGGFNRRSVSKIVIKVASDSTRTIHLDGLLAR